MAEYLQDKLQFISVPLPYVAVCISIYSLLLYVEIIL